MNPCVAAASTAFFSVALSALPSVREDAVAFLSLLPRESNLLGAGGASSSHQMTQPLEHVLLLRSDLRAAARVPGGPPVPDSSASHCQPEEARCCPRSGSPRLEDFEPNLA